MIVLYSDERQRFEAITSYFERDLPKQNRWRWDTRLRRWYTMQQDIAARLKQYAQGAAALRLGLLDAGEQEALQASLASDSALQVPAPPGLHYLPYQRAGIAYMLRPRGPDGSNGTLLGDEMGLGKTIQAIGLVNHLCEASNDRSGHGVRVGGDVHVVRRVLIITPASLRLNWRAEWRRWHTGRLRPILLDHWPSSSLIDHTENAALIVSYDSVRKWHPMIAAVPWDILTLDEAHLVKDAGTRRAKSIFGGKYKNTSYKAIQAWHKVFLTGTPIVNRPEELWPLLKALAPKGLGANQRDFMDRYGGAQRLGELHTKLRAQVMVRRKKEEVLKDLPAKTRQIILLEVPEADDIRAAEARMLEQQRTRIEEARRQLEGLDHQQQVMRLRQCRAMALSEISRIRHETAVKKLPQATEHIYDLLANVDKVVVFTHHHDVADGLQTAFERICVGLDGRTSATDRQAAVARFQSDRRVRLFIGSLRAAGLGLTLTAASVVAFVELDWTPAAMMQAEDRLHRIGQHAPVLVQHLVIDGSIDAKMARLLIDKQAVMDAALDGGSPDGRERDILREVLAA